jgi:hypothetical protein
MENISSQSFLAKFMKIPFRNVWILGVANLIYMCAHIGYLIRNGVDADFRVIFATALRFVSGTEVFFPLNEPLGTAYNSTFLYLLLSPITFFSLSTASRIFLTINVVLVFYISWQASNFLRQQNLKSRTVSFLIVLTILQLSFAYRSTLANGQIGLIFVSLQVLYFRLQFKRDRWSSAFSPLILWFLIELKPYLILPWLVYMLFSRKYFKHILLTFIVGIFFQCVYYLVNISSTFINYGVLLIKRADSTHEELDQASLTSLLHLYFDLDKVSSFIIFVVVLVVPLVYIIRKLDLNEENNFFVIILSAPLFSIYFHRQDSLLASLFLGLLVNEFFLQGERQVSFPLKTLIYTSLVLNLNWGNANLLPAISLLVLMYFLLSCTSIPKSNKCLVLVFSFLMHLGQVYIYQEFGWQGSYKLWTVLVFVFQITMLLSYLFPHLGTDRKNVKL